MAPNDPKLTSFTFIALYIIKMWKRKENKVMIILRVLDFKKSMEQATTVGFEPENLW